VYIHEDVNTTFTRTSITYVTVSSGDFMEGGVIHLRGRSSATLVACSIAHITATVLGDRSLQGGVFFLFDATSAYISDTDVSHVTTQAGMQVRGGGFRGYTRNAGTFESVRWSYINATSRNDAVIGGVIDIGTTRTPVLMRSMTFEHISAASFAHVVQGGVLAFTFSACTIESTVMRHITALSRSTSSDPRQNTVEGGAIAVLQGAGAVVNIVNASITDVLAISSSQKVKGGAVYVHSDVTVSIVSSTIARISAQGESQAQGGGLYSLGDVSIASTTVSHCSARSAAQLGAEGAGLWVGLGSVLLQEMTTFSSNSAVRIVRSQGMVTSSQGLGANIFPAGGAVHYAFPIPAGSWLPNARCLVYREPCGIGEQASNVACRASLLACMATADPTSTSTASINASLCQPSADCPAGTSIFGPCPGGMCPCQPRSLVQPCNWFRWPHLLGSRGYTLPSRLPIDDSIFPFACAPGILGSIDASNQVSATCAGFCPEGYVCPSASTLIPLDCGAGSYCPEGSIVSNPCPAGTYSTAMNLASVDQCMLCPAGSACATGSPLHELCAPGTTSSAGSHSCNPVLDEPSNSGSCGARFGANSLDPRRAVRTRHLFCFAWRHGMRNVFAGSLVRVTQHRTTRSFQGDSGGTVALWLTCERALLCPAPHRCTASAQVPCGVNKYNNESGSFDQERRRESHSRHSRSAPRRLSSAIG
jgi:hypothetical protein